MVGEAFYSYTESGWLSVQHPLVLFIFLGLGGFAFAFLGVVVAF